jgi:hypothetical protein
MLVLPIVLPPSASASSDCEAQRQEFAKLNRPLIIKDASEARLYPVVAESETEKAHKYLDNSVLTYLNGSSSVRPNDLVLLIQCIQSVIPNYEIGRKEGSTNLPVAFLLPEDRPTIAVGFEIYRGGAGAPDIRPYFEVFRRADKGWEQIGEAGASFAQHSFYARPILAGKPGEKWFLLWGRRIGDSGARLRIVVAAYTGPSLHEAWSIDGLTKTEIAGNFEDHLILRREVTNEKGRAQEVQERFDVVPDGLKLSKREVIKSY